MGSRRHVRKIPMDLMLPQVQVHKAQDLERKDQRDPDEKEGLSCLVMKNIHAEQASNGASQDTESYQGGFFDPPSLISGFPFVYAEADESDKR